MPSAAAETNCSPAKPAASRWPWVLLGLWFLLDFALFFQFLQREVVWAYPPKHDQTHYLYDSYHAHESILAEGPVTGLRHQLKDGRLAQRPQGILMVPIEASLLYLVLGASRTTALLVNYLHFVLLQGVLVLTLRWATGRWDLTCLGLGLLLSAMFPFQPAGGLSDFRLDFVSFCMFGVVACLVLRSGPFRDWKWSLLVGAAASLVIWARFITAAYFAGIFGAVGGVWAVRWLWARWKRADRRELNREFWCLLGCASVMCAMVLPVLYWHRKAIEKYYVVGHVTGPEKQIRAEAEGLATFLDHALFYPKSSVRWHIGWTAGILLGTTIVLWGLQVLRGRLTRRKAVPIGSLPVSPLQLGAAAQFLLASIVIPVCILALDEAKSGVVGAVIVPPMILLAMVWVIWCQRQLAGRPGIVTRTGWGLAGITLLGALNLHVSQFGSRTPMSQQQLENRSITAAVDTITDYVLKHRESNASFRQPRIVLDGVYDFINHGVINCLGYERHGVLLDAVNGGGRIFDVTRGEMLGYVSKADIVVLMLGESPVTATYPFDRAMTPIRPALRQFCQENMLELCRFRKAGTDFGVYARHCLQLAGDQGGWMTPAEMSLAVPAGTLKNLGRVQLSGRWLAAVWNQANKAPPSVDAYLHLPGCEDEPLPAEFKVEGGRYELTIHCQPHDTDQAGEIRFRFNDYFVPSEIGPSKDTRRLVTLSPENIEVRAASVTVTGGTKDGWITSDGLTLTVPREFLKSRSSVVLSGPWSFPASEQQPRVLAELQLPNRDPEPLDAELSVSEKRYTLRIDWKPQEREEMGRIRVTFDRHFVPAKLGINPDTREFVSQVPDEVHVLK